jgi:HTH-type transcriptional regulator, sugar sensing transcriptional regulator
MNYRELVHLGLSEKESKVYIAVLELGKTSVQNISKKAEVNRATTYVIIESLMKKGLVSSIDEQKKQFFYAESPEKLKMLFESQELEIIRKLDYLDKLLPELRALNPKSSDRPIVKYYEGREGVAAMNKEFHKAKNQISRMIYSVDMVKKTFEEDERKKSREDRIKSGIKSKVLYTYKNGILETTEDGERKKIPYDKFPINADIAIFDNKIRIASLGDKIFGIIIEDKEIVDTFISIFELAWFGADKQEKS